MCTTYASYTYPWHIKRTVRIARRKGGCVAVRKVERDPGIEGEGTSKRDWSCKPANNKVSLPPLPLPPSTFPWSLCSSSSCLVLESLVTSLLNLFRPWTRGHQIRPGRTSLRRTLDSVEYMHCKKKCIEGIRPGTRLKFFRCVEDKNAGSTSELKDQEKMEIVATI